MKLSDHRCAGAINRIVMLKAKPQAPHYSISRLTHMHYDLHWLVRCFSQPQINAGVQLGSVAVCINSQMWSFANAKVGKEGPAQLSHMPSAEIAERTVSRLLRCRWARFNFDCKRCSKQISTDEEQMSTSEEDSNAITLQQSLMTSLGCTYLCAAYLI